MQFHSKKVWTFFVTLVVFVTLLTAGGTALPALASVQSRSNPNFCGEEGAPSDKAYEIRDFIDSLPAISADMHVSDPFLLLASEVSYREENGMPITSETLVNNCTEAFNPPTGGIAYNLSSLNYAANWRKILGVYQKKYDKDYPAIRDALNKLKDQATKYAKAHDVLINPILGIPKSGTIGEMPMALSVVSRHGDEAILHAQGGRNAKVVVHDANTNKKINETGLLKRDDATIPIRGLKPDYGYKFSLVDLYQNKAVSAFSLPTQREQEQQETEPAITWDFVKGLSTCVLSNVAELSKIVIKEGPLVAQLTRQYGGKVIIALGKKYKIDKIIRILPNVDKSVIGMDTGTAVLEDASTGKIQYVFFDIVLAFVAVWVPEVCAAKLVFDLTTVRADG